MTNEFSTRLNGFVEGTQKLVDHEYRGCSYKPVITLEAGKKFIRVVKADGVQKSAYCFIEMDTGHILKADSWKRPAKGIRGSIFKDDFGLNSMTAYGTYYMNGRG